VHSAALTLNFVLADIDKCRRVDEVGFEVIDHYDGDGGGGVLVLMLVLQIAGRESVLVWGAVAGSRLHS
jgi:hypothetical protein